MFSGSNGTHTRYEKVASSHRAHFYSYYYITLSLTGNSLVCIAFYRNRRLPAITNFYVLSLAVADLMVAVLRFPFGAVVSGFPRWPFSFSFDSANLPASLRCTGVRFQRAPWPSHRLTDIFALSNHSSTPSISRERKRFCPLLSYGFLCSFRRWQYRSYIGGITITYTAEQHFTARW